MTVAILGSGFGLYGYLPALLRGCGKQVVLPLRYRERLLSRKDVGQFTDLVEWTKNDEAMLDRADTVVIAQRPVDQAGWTRACLKRSNVTRLLLEKPIAPDPGQAVQLLDEVESSGKRFLIGYTFRYTDWGRALLGLRRDLFTKIEIRWCFRAHHYAADVHNWKRLVSAGGGAVRFYGIHLIALLSEVGYDRVISSRVQTQAKDEARSWQAVLTGAGLPECHIDLDTNSPSKLFSIRAGHLSADARMGFELADPFASGVTDSDLDYRVAVLTALCRDLFLNDAVADRGYRSSVQLWQEIETKTNIELGPHRPFES